MRSISLACVLALCMLTGAASGELVDGILATVDTEVILHSDVMEEIGPLLASMQQGQSQEAFNREAEKAMREALDQAIEKKILYREALLAGIEVSDDDVEDRLARIKKQYDSNEEFMRILEEAGETISDFRARMRKEIMAFSMGLSKRRLFEQEATISESGMLQYYDEHLADFSHPERVRARRIFLQADKDPQARAAVKARLEALKAELDLGADFAELAKAHSEGPGAAAGGLVGWIMPGDLVPELEQVAFSLPAAGVSDPLEMEYGFLLLTVEAKEAAGTLPFDEARTQIEPILRAQYADERYDKWMNELRKRSRVRVYL